MLEIFVDADACPVKDEIVRVAERHGLRVHLVSNSGMFGFHGHPLVTQTVVADGADVADDWIADRIGAGDIVVTQDILGLTDWQPAFARPICELGDTLMDAAREWMRRVSEDELGEHPYRMKDGEPAQPPTSTPDPDVRESTRS